jgi:hypothetical protein
VNGLFRSPARDGWPTLFGRAGNLGILAFCLIRMVTRDPPTENLTSWGLFYEIVLVPCFVYIVLSGIWLGLVVTGAILVEAWNYWRRRRANRF